MTLEQLCGGVSAEVLEKMSDAELLKHFEASLDITRVDRQTVQTRTKNAGTKRISESKKKELETNEKLARLSKQFNLDMSFMNEE